jgi:hypothetical protein
MNSLFKPTLAGIYRRFTRSGAPRELPDVDALLALAEGERSSDTERLLGDVAHSGLHADLLRFARALAPESARLGVRLEHAFDEMQRAGHRRVDSRTPRRAARRHGGLRTVASLAACLLVAMAVWLLQPAHKPAPAPGTAKAAPATLHRTDDRIFAAVDASRQGHGDVIFRAQFASDRIFTAKFNGG